MVRCDTAINLGSDGPVRNCMSKRRGGSSASLEVGCFVCSQLLIWVNGGGDRTGGRLGQRVRRLEGDLVVAISTD